MGTGDRAARSASAAITVSTPAVIPLENGDRLSRREFEERYRARPDIKKAELIEGVVHVPSPVRATHAMKHGDLLAWLRVYSASTPGVAVLDNATVRLDFDNEPQPDVLMRIESAAFGQSRLDADDYVTGPPELVAEVAASSAAFDLHDKLRVYRRNGVKEYLVWQVYDRSLEWFVLTAGGYEPLAPDAGGMLHSRTFPGLRLAVKSLLDGDFATVLSALNEGIDTPEHAAFDARLRTNGLR